MQFRQLWYGTRKNSGMTHDALIELLLLYDVFCIERQFYEKSQQGN